MIQLLHASLIGGKGRDVDLEYISWKCWNTIQLLPVSKNWAPILHGSWAVFNCGLPQWSLLGPLFFFLHIITIYIKTLLVKHIIQVCKNRSRSIRVSGLNAENLYQKFTKVVCFCWNKFLMCCVRLWPNCKHNSNKRKNLSLFFSQEAKNNWTTSRNVSHRLLKVIIFDSGSSRKFSQPKHFSAKILDWNKVWFRKTAK